MLDTSDAQADRLIQTGILNLEDLEMNRSGHLSQRQKQKLGLNIAVWLGLAVFETSILFALIFFEFFIHRDILIACLGIALFVSLTYICFREARPFWEDIKNDEPKSVTGILIKHFHTAGGGKTPRIAFCSIRVQNQVFSISPSIYDHVIHEDVYRVYYVAKTRKVINIEPLRQK